MKELLLVMTTILSISCTSDDFCDDKPPIHSCESKQFIGTWDYLDKSSNLSDDTCLSDLVPRSDMNAIIITKGHSDRTIKIGDRTASVKNCQTVNSEGGLTSLAFSNCLHLKSENILEQHSTYLFVPLKTVYRRRK